MAGYDGIWIEGRAEKPVYLWVRSGDEKGERIEIRPAEHLWGLETYQTQEKIEQELGSGKLRVATVGLAGENFVPFANILTDHGRMAGRTGMGAVMGWKNLKAIAVQGYGKVPVANVDRYMPLRSEANRTLRSDPMTLVLRELGTSSAAEYFDYLGEMPKKYYQNEIFKEEVLTTGSQMKEKYLAGVSACHACVIACGRVVRLADGEKRKGPEYETLIGFGPNLWLNDIPLTTRLGELCDRYGMDTISLSNTIGLAYKLFEMGKITSQDTGGVELVWGDGSPLETLIHQTAHREGFGALLSLGARALGRHFGAEEEAVQVNGLEAAYHDPRGASGYAIVYATSPRGACHNQSDYYLVDIGQAEASLGMHYLHRHAGGEKAKNVAIHQDWRTVNNSLVLCVLANVAPEVVLALINAACGLRWKIEDVLHSGERGWNLKRAINNRLGLTRFNDKLPKAFLNPYVDSPHGEDGYVPPFDEMIEAYYAVRGWDLQTGYPTPGKLHELCLDFLVKDLWEK
jgi:aldehyde:ferredoxin oxidoreductase